MIPLNESPASPGETVVLALGSPHGDDRVGWLVADELLRRSLSGIRVQRLETPWDVVDHCAADQDTIIVDACVTDSVPGASDWVSQDRLARTPNPRSSHGIDLPAVLGLMATLGTLPRRLAILGIEIAPPAPPTPGESVGPIDVAAAVEKILQRRAEWNVLCSPEDR